MAQAKDTNQKPAKVGRKPRAGTPGKMIGILVTPQERAAYQAAADERSMTLSEWIRDCCARVLKRKRS